MRTGKPGDFLDKVPPKHWTGVRVAVYGNCARGRDMYLYDAVTLPKWPDYDSNSKRVIVRPITDNPLVGAKPVEPQKCEIVEYLP